MKGTLSESDRAVFRKYAGLSLPRHVAYPMPNWWGRLDAETVSDVWRDAAACARDENRGLSVYVHLPFCHSLCKFCGCNKVILKQDRPDASARVERFLDALLREIDQLADSASAWRAVEQLHLGGGTPTYLSVEQLERILDRLHTCLPIAPDAERAVEIDPRVTTEAQLAALRRWGFGRVSLGVQDFDPQVQEHIRRIQPREQVAETVRQCRALGYESVNFDIIYGMPYQTRSSMARTVDEVIALGPDRIAFYHYAQVPEKIATQRGIDHTKLPSSEEKLDMFLDARRAFEEAGYLFIGLDHFARPDEALSRALRDGTLGRNFQGMTTGRPLDLVGIGPSAISHFRGTAYIQNEPDEASYVEAVSKGASCIARGIRLSRDDIVRQTLLEDFYGQGTIVPARYEKAFGITFWEYFAEAREGLEELARDGVVTIDADGTIRTTDPLGRILMRNVGALFDAYLHPEAYREGARHEYSTNA